MSVGPHSYTQPRSSAVFSLAYILLCSSSMDGSHAKSSPSEDKLTPSTTMGDVCGVYCSCSALSFRYSEHWSVQYIVHAGKQCAGVVVVSAVSGQIFPSHQRHSMSCEAVSVVGGAAPAFGDDTG